MKIWNALENIKNPFLNYWWLIKDLGANHILECNYELSLKGWNK